MPTAGYFGGVRFCACPARSPSSGRAARVLVLERRCWWPFLRDGGRDDRAGDDSNQYELCGISFSSPRLYAIPGILKLAGTKLLHSLCSAAQVLAVRIHRGVVAGILASGVTIVYKKLATAHVGSGVAAATLFRHAQETHANASAGVCDRIFTWRNVDLTNFCPEAMSSRNVIPPPSAIEGPLGAKDFVTTVLTQPSGLSISLTRCGEQLGTDEAPAPIKSSTLTHNNGRTRASLDPSFR